MYGTSFYRMSEYKRKNTGVYRLMHSGIFLSFAVLIHILVHDFGDGNSLWTYGFAAVAADAADLCGPVLFIKFPQNLRDPDPLGTVVQTVTAPGTGDLIRPDHIPGDLMDRRQLLPAERLCLSEGIDIFPQLLHIGHAGKHHRHTGHAL